MQVQSLLLLCSVVAGTLIVVLLRRLDSELVCPLKLASYAMLQSQNV